MAVGCWQGVRPAETRFKCTLSSPAELGARSSGKANAKQSQRHNRFPAAESLSKNNGVGYQRPYRDCPSSGSAVSVSSWEFEASYSSLSLSRRRHLPPRDL